MIHSNDEIKLPKHYKGTLRKEDEEYTQKVFNIRYKSSMEFLSYYQIQMDCYSSLVLFLQGGMILQCLR